MNVILAELRQLCGSNHVYYDNYKHRVIYRNHVNLLVDTYGNLYLAILYNGVKTRSITFIDIISMVSNYRVNLRGTRIDTKPTLYYECRVNTGDTIYFTLGSKYHLLYIGSPDIINAYTPPPSVDSSILKDRLELIKIIWILRNTPLPRMLQLKVVAHCLI